MYFYNFSGLALGSTLFNSSFNVTTMLKIPMQNVGSMHYLLFYKKIMTFLAHENWRKLKQCG